jgi:predicted PurR-regulated permease PerM
MQHSGNAGGTERSTSAGVSYARAVSAGTDPRHTVAIEIPIRTLIVAAFVVAIAVALISIRDALLIVFIGVFLALVFEYPVRALMQRTHLSRGLASAIVVLGTAAIGLVLALLLLVPLVGGLRDFLQDLPEIVADLRESGELEWLGDSGAGENAQAGAEDLAAEVPSAVGALLGVAGQAFSVGLALFTILFLCMFLLMDMPRLKASVTSLLMPETGERTLAVWEAVTHTVSRWAIGALTIAVIAGVIQGGTAWLLGSSWALALGVIAGVLDLIPNLGATIAGFILVPAVLAEEGLTAALIMLVVVLVYQQLENNVLQPAIQGKATDISPFFIILGVTVFGALLGVLGALVAIPVVASIQIVAREVTAERRARVATAKAALAATEP